MTEWKTPENVLNMDELKQKSIPFFCSEGYVFYSYFREIIRMRDDGTEAIMLYYKVQAHNYGIDISEVRDGYVYFTISGSYTFQASDPMYEAVYRFDTYRVKADESRELQLLSEREDYMGFGADEFTPGTTHTYNPPKILKNPAKL
ncbi:MAG: hypothetical protein FWD36_09945 [Treponema sp.]|nr:hypothetical protein [Treponema sp.]